MSICICWKGECGFWKPPSEGIWWPRACRHFNVALNERALTRQVAARSGERRAVWSSCIRNEWKERKTTQQHGQIRLSETIFKIWVRVQPVTSLTHSPLLYTPSSAPPFLLHLIPPLLSLSLLPLLFTHFTNPRLLFVHSFLPPRLFLLSICQAWHALPEPSTEAAALPSACVVFRGQHLQIKITLAGL